jgi:hypothetical protein
MNALLPYMLVLGSALASVFIHLVPFNFRHVISQSQDTIYEIRMHCSAE